MRNTASEAETSTEVYYGSKIGGLEHCSALFIFVQEVWNLSHHM